MNLVSNDVRRFDDIGPYAMHVWAGPLEVVCVLVMVGSQLTFLAAIAGIATLLLLIPFQVGCCPSVLAPMPRTCPSAVHAWAGPVELVGAVVGSQPLLVHLAPLTAHPSPLTPHPSSLTLHPSPLPPHPSSLWFLLLVCHLKLPGRTHHFLSLAFAFLPLERALLDLLFHGIGNSLGTAHKLSSGKKYACDAVRMSPYPCFSPCFCISFLMYIRNGIFHISLAGHMLSGSNWHLSLFMPTMQDCA